MWYAPRREARTPGPRRFCGHKARRARSSRATVRKPRRPTATRSRSRPGAGARPDLTPSQGGWRVSAGEGRLKAEARIHARDGQPSGNLRINLAKQIRRHGRAEKAAPVARVIPDGGTPSAVPQGGMRELNEQTGVLPREGGALPYERNYQERQKWPLPSVNRRTSEF